jgi:membrane-associated phospholipid phosphatase
VSRPRTAVVLALAVVVLAVLWIGVATGTLLAAVDPVVDGWIAAVRPAWLVAAAVVVSEVCQPAVLIAVLVLVAAVLGWRRRSWAPVVIGAAGIVALGVLDQGVKALVARPRPPLEWQAYAAHGLSFPSGHALWSCGVLLLVVVLVGPGRARPFLVVVAVLVTLAVGGARLVLAVHYPSDVLAGWTLGATASLVSTKCGYTRI